MLKSRAHQTTNWLTSRDKRPFCLGKPHSLEVSPWESFAARALSCLDISYTGKKGAGVKRGFRRAWQMDRTESLACAPYKPLYELQIFETMHLSIHWFLTRSGTRRRETGTEGREGKDRTRFSFPSSFSPQAVPSTYFLSVNPDWVAFAGEG